MPKTLNSLFWQQIGKDFTFLNRIVNSSGVMVKSKCWIPAGILPDLMDNAPDMVRFGLTDNAGTFTNQEFFNSLDYDVHSPQAFRDRLMYRTSNRDQADVNRLFEAYHFN